ncbi:MAG: hypothetical protein KKC72_07290, partial [Alphaproteobacteria bacterium]|nr:hypothetical protein [Alphaproteobacteria bacterium]MBU1837749.1 hypothetical protein [Alphaproteobacteria bacterium]
ALIIRLVNDMKSGQLTLNNLLNSKSKNSYIDNLAIDGLLPKTIASPPLPPPSKPSPPPAPLPRPTPAPSPSRPRRDSLIPNVEYGLTWSSDQQKISAVWNELQHDLNLSKTKLAIAALFRVLLELVAHQYMSHHKIDDQRSLAKNLRCVLRRIAENKQIDRRSETDIDRILTDRNAVNSIENLQRYLHSASQTPASDDLISIWDCIAPLVLAALKSSQKPQLEQ